MSGGAHSTSLQSRPAFNPPTQKWSLAVIGSAAISKSIKKRDEVSLFGPSFWGCSEGGGAGISRRRACRPSARSDITLLRKVSLRRTPQPLAAPFGTPRPCRPWLAVSRPDIQPSSIDKKAPFIGAFLSIELGGVWSPSLHLVINLNWTSLDLRIQLPSRRRASTACMSRRPSTIT